MTSEEGDNESRLNEPNERDKPQSPSRSVWLRGFAAMPRRRGKKLCSPEERQSDASDRSIFGRKTEAASPSSRSLRLREDEFRPTHRAGTEDDESGSGKSSESSKVLKKTMTFSGIIGNRKGKTSVETEAKQTKDAFESMQLLPDSESSSTDKDVNIEEEYPHSGSKSDKLRLMKGSHANRTVFFKRDIPPCSPVSAKGQASAITEALSRSRKSTKAEIDRRSWKNRPPNIETSLQEDEKQPDAVFDGETSGAQNMPASTRLFDPVTLLNMRHGSMVFESEQSVAPLKSSPLPSPRKMLSSLSSSPRHRRKSFERKLSTSCENRDRTRGPVRKENESPWGIQDTVETDKERRDRHPSRKSFRRLSVVLRLSKKKSASSSSNSFNLSDEETC